MKEIRREDADLVLSFDPYEYRLLESLPLRLRERLQHPDFMDPVVRRLYPDASRDPRVEAEFRAWAAEDIRQRKLEHLDAFAASLRDVTEEGRREREVRLKPIDVEHWIGFLNDLRLLLGTRLNITQDDWREHVRPDEVEDPDLLLYLYLTYIQSNLLEV